MRPVKRTVLLIEDDLELNHILQSFLEKQGYEVLTATNRTSAEKWLQRQSGPIPDLVLSDIRLGGQSGIDIARDLARTHPETPIILMSVIDQLEKEALQSGATHFFKKPFLLETMEKAIRDALHNRRRGEKLQIHT